MIFSHGFRGTKSGPSRTFVSAARRFARLGISSLRFDQYGSGDSDGDFLDSRFTDWISTIQTLARRELEKGRRVALFGQSMGASATICAASALPIEAAVAWVPDASTDAFVPGVDGYVEEAGERVGNAFWEEAHSAGIAARLREIEAPCYLVFGTADEYVSTENREVLIDAAKPSDQVDVFEGYPHSAWTYDQADEIIDRSVRFLSDRLAA